MKDVSRADRFTDLYERNHDDVLRFVRRRTDPERAEDVAHETFLVAWRRFDEVPRRPPDARAWLFGVARNCLLNDRRGGARREAVGVRLAAQPVRPAPGHEDSVVVRDALATAWSRLTAAEQEVLALELWEQLTSPEAGRVLGISAAAYRHRLSRARAALRGHLDTPHLDRSPLQGVQR